MPIVEFLIGGVYTLSIIAIAFVIGLYVGARAEPELYNDLKRSFRRPTKLQSGPIKPLTKAEREKEGTQFMNDFVEKL